MKEIKSSFQLTDQNAILIYIAIAKFLLMLLFAGNYGIFRDEYYYIECSKNLSWGFVDQPPLSALILFVSRSLFGESLIAIRIFAYLAGSITVFIAGLLAREMGGNKYAQGLAATAALFSGVLLGTGSYFSMNAFDILFSSLIFYLILRLLNTQKPVYWIYIGILFGIGLMNKLSPLFLGAGLAIALLITENRRYFLSKELWIGTVIAFIIFLPNIIWQFANNFPTPEFIRNASMYKNQPMSFIDFLLGMLLELNPASTILLAAGLYFLFFSQAGRKFRVIGWIFISVFMIFLFNNGKTYYLGVLFPVILAAGSAGAEEIIRTLDKRWLRYVLIIVLLPGYLFALPFALPVLDVGTFISYSDITGIKPASGERSELGLLPQFFADRFGWEEMVQKTALAYNKLTEEEKNKVLIFGQNYGQSGAVNYYRHRYGLPKAISSHNNFWIWGYPEWFTGEIMIVIGSNLRDNMEYFEQVQPAATHYHPYGMPYENVDIFICRKPKMPLSVIWQRIKNYI